MVSRGGPGPLPAAPRGSRKVAKTPKKRQIRRKPSASGVVKKPSKSSAAPPPRIQRLHDAVKLKRQAALKRILKQTNRGSPLKYPSVKGMVDALRLKGFQVSRTTVFGDLKEMGNTCYVHPVIACLRKAFARCLVSKKQLPKVSISDLSAITCKGQWVRNRENLWPVLHREVGKLRPRTAEQLTAAVTRAWDNLSLQIINKLVGRFKGRFEKEKKKTQ